MSNGNVCCTSRGRGSSLLNIFSRAPDEHRLALAYPACDPSRFIKTWHACLLGYPALNTSVRRFSYGNLVPAWQAVSAALTRQTCGASIPYDEPLLPIGHAIHLESFDKKLLAARHPTIDERVGLHFVGACSGLCFKKCRAAPSEHGNSHEIDSSEDASRVPAV